MNISLNPDQKSFEDELKKRVDNRKKSPPPWTDADARKYVNVCKRAIKPGAKRANFSKSEIHKRIQEVLAEVGKISTMEKVLSKLKDRNICTEISPKEGSLCFFTGEKENVKFCIQYSDLIHVKNEIVDRTEIWLFYFHSDTYK